MKQEGNHQLISLAQTSPYLTQTFSIASEGKTIGCSYTNEGLVIIITTEKSDYQYSENPYQSNLKNYNHQGQLLSKSQIYMEGDVVSFQVVKDSSVIIENLQNEMRHNDWFSASYLHFLDTKRMGIVERSRRMEERWRQKKVQYWTFSQNQIICVLEREQNNNSENLSLKLSYYNASREFPLVDIATFGGTYYNQKLLINCYQLDSHSKIGWVAKGKEGKIICYILTLGNGLTKIDTLNVSLNQKKYGSDQFWLPLWSISKKGAIFTYLMAHLRLLSKSKYYNRQVVNYCICQVENGQIHLKTRLEIPRKKQNAKIFHEKASMLEGGIFILEYHQISGKNQQNKIDSLFDPSRNSFYMLNTFPHLPITVYPQVGSKGIVILQKEVQGEARVEEESKWKAKVTTIFTGYSIKDAYMGLLLELNQSFDDDLLCDAITLLIE